MLVISVVSTMIMARLLTPSEIGLFSLAAIFVNLAHSVRGFGVGQYIVQEPDLTPERIRTAFGITLVIAWSIAVVLVLVSPLAADFYNEEGVGSVLRVLALNFAIIPFGSILISLINREMRFEIIFRISVLSELLRHVSAITLAWLGFGYMSLAWGAVVGVASTVLLTQVFSPRRMKVYPGFKEWRRVLNFGGSATVSAIAKDLQDGSPEIVIGRAMDTASVGFFGKAVAVNKLFDKVVLSGVRPAVLPHLAAKHRAGESIKGFYTHGLSLVTALAWPFYAFVAVMAFPMVRILYGDQWDATVPLARLLCIYAAIDVMFAFAGQALVSVGQIRRLVWLRLATFLVTLTVVMLAISYGLQAVALAMIAPAITGLILSYRLLRVTIGLMVNDYLHAIGASAAVTAAACVVPVMYTFAVDMREANVFVSVTVGLLGSASLWFLAVVLMRHPILKEIELLLGQMRAKFAGNG